MSSQNCGCDPEAMWKCDLHRSSKQRQALLRVEDFPVRPTTVRTVREDFTTQPGEARDISTEDLLRQKHPYGHPRFLPITLREIALHSDKNHDYAKGGEPLGNFTRVATILALYPDLKLSDPRIVALTYAMKQLDAVLWGMNSGIKHKVEGANQRLQDISVYVKLVMCMNEDTEAI